MNSLACVVANLQPTAAEMRPMMIWFEHILTCNMHTALPYGIIAYYMPMPRNTYQSGGVRWESVAETETGVVLSTYH